jgi:hypothetical protein
MTIKLKTVMGVLAAGGLVAGLASCDNKRGSDASGTKPRGGTSSESGAGSSSGTGTGGTGTGGTGTGTGTGSGTGGTGGQ